MALAVAMVACSAAAKPGPAGPTGEQGPKGDPGEPATTPEPGETPAMTGPVQIVNSIDNLVFHDMDGEMDTMAQVVMAAEHFFPTGLMYSLDDLTEDQMKRIDVGDGIDEATGMLTVMLKDKAGYKNDKLTVHATDRDSKKSISFYVRRNQAPRMPAAANLSPVFASPVWVGTQKDVVLMAKDVHDADNTIAVSDIRVAIMDKAGPTAGDGKHAHFEDDPGNKLSFDPELVSTKLMATGGEMKVMLRGKKSTGANSNDIELHLVASDGHFMSADSVHVANVRVDEHPMIVKGAALSDVVLKLSNVAGLPNATDTILNATLTALFSDDRDGSGLILYAYLDGDDVVKLTDSDGTPTVLDDETPIVESSNLVITALKRGRTTVMVKAREPSSDSTLGGNLGQWSDPLSFEVIVE